MNPFILTSYHSPEHFCDRENETERLLSAINNNRNVALISKRRMGKTGLLMHLERQLAMQKEQQFVYFDVLSASSLQDFVNLFANALFKSNNRNFEKLFKSFSKIFSAFKPSFSINPITGETKFNLDISNISESESSLTAIFNYIQKINKKFVIAIDEFQQITSFSENNTEALLRSHIQHINNAVFIFSGSSRKILGEMFSDKNRAFYMSSEIMYLDKIDRNSYSEFILKHFTKGNFKISENSTYFLLDLVKTHTYYVQLLCNRLYSQKKKEITEIVIAEVLSKILEENKFYFESYRKILTNFQWKVVQSIAFEGEVAEPTSKDFIEKHHLGSSSSVSTAFKSLEEKEIISFENSKYVLQDLLFSFWLSSK
ncbi:MAG: hypothetical protein A2X64_02215 [Ignavibacteria bacterium GWF2_33_9]|nr:MAG: hypothetical protein A2X64_02215 [Ignavibacteria bacterium GWF2_33_9]